MRSGAAGGAAAEPPGPAAPPGPKRSKARFPCLGRSARIAHLSLNGHHYVVTIRLARHGGKKHPFYHVTVAEKSAKRDGRFIERLGFYNPVARGAEEELRIDLGRADYWLGAGAQPTERVRQLIERSRKQQVVAAPNS